MTFPSVLHRLFLGMLGLLFIVSCNDAWEDHLKTMDQYDSDGDGVPDIVDCEPDDAQVAGDFDCDGWFDSACSTYRPTGMIGWWNDNCTYRVEVVEGLYQDCMDIPSSEPGAPDPSEVHPGQEGFDDLKWEIPCNDPTLRGTSACFKPCGEDGSLPVFANDGWDNDCDGIVDVSDFDGDGYLRDAIENADCNDCLDSVNPGINEYQTVSGCPVYAYDNVDNDCNMKGDLKGDVTDWDGDGVDGGAWGEVDCSEVRNSTFPDKMVSDLAKGSDCDDLVETTYPGALERCDIVDQNCDGEPYDDFSLSDDKTRRIVYVSANDAPASDENRTGMTRETAFASLGEAMAVLPYCTEFRVYQGEYRESIALNLEALALPDTGKDSDDTDEDSSSRAVIPEVSIIGEQDGVVLLGDDARALNVGMGDDQTLSISNISFLGGATDEGGLQTSGGSVNLNEVSFSGISNTKEGGGLSMNGFSEASLLQVTFDGNTARFGGGLYASGSTLNLVDVEAENNDAFGSGGGIYTIVETMNGAGISLERNISEAGTGGGLYAVTNKLVATNLDAVENLSELGGGGVYVAARNATFSELTLLSNASSIDGGGAYIIANSVEALDGVNASGNTAGGFGGGLFLFVGTAAEPEKEPDSDTSSPDTGVAEVADFEEEMPIGKKDDVSCPDAKTKDVLMLGSFSLNENFASGDGGGLYVTSPQAVVIESVSGGSGNVSGGDGAVVFGSFPDRVSFSVVDVDCGSTSGMDMGSADNGGAIAVQGGKVCLPDLSASTCRSSVGGGALYVAADSAEVAVRGLSNNSSYFGGALSLWTISGAEVSCAIPDCVLSDNFALHGGNIYFGGSSGARIEDINVECSGSSGSTGGGIFASGGSVTMEDASFNGCNATMGGALYLVNLTEATIDGVALTDNSGTYGGHIYLSAGTFHLDNLSVIGSDRGISGIDRSGALFLDGEGFIANSAFTGFSGSFSSTYLQASGSGLSMSNCLFHENSAGGGGRSAGVLMDISTTSASLSNVTVANNHGMVILPGELPEEGALPERDATTLEGVVVSGNGHGISGGSDFSCVLAVGNADYNFHPSTPTGTVCESSSSANFNSDWSLDTSSLPAPCNETESFPASCTTSLGYIP